VVRPGAYRPVVPPPRLGALPAPLPRPVRRRRALRGPAYGRGARPARVT
jgi:hypothetical protein